MGRLEPPLWQILVPAFLPVSLDLAETLIQLLPLIARELSTKATVLNPHKSEVFTSLGHLGTGPIVFYVIDHHGDDFAHIYHRKLNGRYDPLPRRKLTSDLACIWMIERT